MKIMDEVHSGKRPKFTLHNFEDEIYIRGEECNVPPLLKRKKKKKGMSNFLRLTCAPPTPLTTHHTFHSLTLLAGQLMLPSLSLSFLISHKYNILYSLPLSFHSLTGAHLIATSTIFQARFTRKLHRKKVKAHLSQLLEVKISNLFGVFYTFA